MKQLKIEKVLVYVVTLSLLIIYLADGLSKYLIQYLEVDISILPNRYVKGLLILSSLTCSFIFLKKTSKVVYKTYLLLLSLVLINCINWVLFDQSFDYLAKYSCFFFFAPLFFFKGGDQLWIHHVDRLFRFLVYINLCFIILGLLFDLQIFKTYYSRFGYNGLLLTSMQATYFYISAIVIAFHRRQKLFFILSVLSALLVGTKILLGFLACFGGWLIFSKFKNGWLKLVLIVGLASSFAFALMLLFGQERFKIVIADDGIAAAVFSFRNVTLSLLWEHLDHLDYSILSGGISLFDYRVEIEPIDVLLYFGTLGLVVYILFFKLLKEYFLSKKISFFYFTIVLFFIIIAGNFLYYPINCFLFLLTLKSLSIHYQNSTTTLND